MSADFLELSIRELSRNFGRRRALSRVSLDCRAGEIVGLLGPNGAGKSTLLGIISTLAAPSSGAVLYGGRSAKELGAPLRSRIGVLSHDLHLYSELTALEKDAGTQLFNVDEGRGTIRDIQREIDSTSS